MDQPPSTSRNSARRSPAYMYTLTAAILMMLLLFTAVIVLIIVGRAGPQNARQFDTTLTAIYADVAATDVARVSTPTNAPPITQGEYIFTPETEPVYSALEPCAAQVVTGQVLDDEGDPTDRYTVLVWGDFLPATPITTGELSGESEGRWTLTLDGMINRRLWVQITVGNRYFSAPVEIVFDQTACDRNQVEIVFRQAAPITE